MKVKELKNRIDTARARLALLEQGRAALTAHREQQILNAPAPTDHSHSAARARVAAKQILNGWDAAAELCVGGGAGDWLRRERIGLNAIEDEIRDLTDALDLLEGKLPSAEEVAAADERIERLADQAGDLRVEVEIASARLLDQLAEAAETARELTGARAQYRQAVSEAHGEAEAWGRPVEDLPRALTSSTDSGLEIPAPQQRLAGALVKLVKGAVAGSWQSDATAEAEIKSQRHALRQESEAA